MRIAGNQETVGVLVDLHVFTTPYRLPSTPFWCVSVKSKESKDTLYKVHFDNHNASKRFKATKKEFIDVIRLDIINDSGGVLKQEYFGNNESLKSYVKKMTQDDSSKLRSEAEKVEMHQIMVLEDLAKEDFGDLPEAIDGDLEEKLRQFEDEYKTKTDAAESDARNLLNSVAKFYLAQKYIDNNDFLKYKLKIETEGLSALFFQINISTQASKNLLKQIYMGSASVKQYDALAQLQRVILDVNKYRSQLIKDVVDDLKKMEERSIIVQSDADQKDLELGDQTGISTANRKELIERMNKLKEEMGENGGGEENNK